MRSRLGVIEQAVVEATHRPSSARLRTDVISTRLWVPRTRAPVVLEPRACMPRWWCCTPRSVQV
eukprot:scaffold81040_cov63-Phaeocystis_antarctica.AAC.2